MSKVNDFLLTKGWSYSTIEKYRRAINLLEKDFKDLSLFTAADFSDWIHSKGWGSSCSWVYYTAIKLYLTWLFGVSHPALAFKYKRKKSPPQRYLKLDQVKSLLGVFDTSTPKGRRDLAIAVLFLDSGLRVSEVCNLELNRVHLEDLKCDVVIKGGNWASALFSEYTRSCIINWLGDRNNFACQSNKFLFCSLGGNTPGKKFTREGLQQVVRNWGESISLKLSPHDLRRTFAILATIAGSPSRTLQVGGRWADISMVEHYTESLQLDSFRPYLPVNFIMKE